MHMGAALHRTMVDGADGARGWDEIERSRGTPQGGVISPILANLFLHYAFDLWMARTYPRLRWCRYADDGLVHCRSEMEAQSVQGSASSSSGGVPPGIASDEDQDRLLQGRQTPRQVSETVILTFSAIAFGHDRSWGRLAENVLWFTPSGQHLGLKAMRATIRDLSLRHQTSCRWTILPASSTRS